MEDKSVFVEFLGDYPLIKVMDFLIENRIYDYTKKEISDGAGVAWSTLNALWPELERFGVVKPTRAIGRATLYRLNTDSPAVQKLIELDTKLTLSFSAGVKEEAETVGVAE